MFKNEYLSRVYAQAERRDPEQPEFLQAVREVLEACSPWWKNHPEYEKTACWSAWWSRSGSSSSGCRGWTTRAGCR